MKKIARILTAVMVLALVLSLASPAMAALYAGETTGDGKITISNAVVGQTYTIYRIANLESYSGSNYSYSVNSYWQTFFINNGVNVTSGHLDYDPMSPIVDVEKFAKDALAYAKADTASGNTTPYYQFTATTTTVVFENLPLGYYVVDSSLGALCGLTTTHKEAAIVEKNGIPTIIKQVKEDSTNAWGPSNTADIGQVVEFRATINVHEGAEGYVFHDKMSAGLTFDPASVVVHHIDTSAGTDTIAPTSYYSVVHSGLTDDCTFEVIFTPGFCEHLDINDKVVVYYNATVNENAVVGNAGNPNEAKLKYGEDNYTVPSTTITYTFGLDIVKTDSENAKIDGAEFRIYDAATGGNEVAVVKMSDGNYRRAKSGETGEAIIVTGGQVRVIGFDNGEYYLEETKAPTGYNKLTARVKFIIADSNKDAVYTDGHYTAGSGVHVVNQTGTILPETGGIGTVIFVSTGAFLVVTMGVLLVVKKRMGSVIFTR